MIKEVNLKGLSSSPSDHASADGELGTCLNLINEDGTLKPIFPAVETGDSIPDKCTIEFVHKVTHNQETHLHYILKFAQGNVTTWEWMEMSTEDNESDGTLNKIDISHFSVNAVTAVGNILCFVGEDRTLYAFWKTDKYVVLDLSQIEYTASAHQQSEKSTLSLDTLQPVEANLDTYVDKDKGTSLIHFMNGDNEAHLAQNISSDVLQNLFSDAYAMVRKSMSDNSFTYIQVCVMAARLYDGTHILIGRPFLSYSLYHGDSTRKLNSKINDSVYLVYSQGKQTLKADGYKELSLADGTYLLTKGESIYSTEITVSFKNISDYEDIIDGIDVFVSEPIYPFNTKSATYDAEKIDGLVFDLGQYGKYEWNFFHNWIATAAMVVKYEPYTLIDFYSKIDECILYKTTSFTYNELSETVTKTLKRAYGTEETLSLADMKRTIIGADCAIAYNNRLHLANVHCRVNDSSAGSIHLGDTSSNMKYYFLVDVTYTQNGQTFRSVTYETVSEVFPSLICFPGLKVTKVQLYARYKDNYYTKSITFHNSDTFGCAYWINYDPDNGTVSELTLEDFSSSTIDAWANVYKAYTSQSNTPIHYPSVIRVSEAENPFVFSASDSVTVGSAQIKALGTNTRPISEGQFGDAPLYAFTDEGVWMVMLGSEGTYQARQPVNREILSNSKSVLPIDDAIVYATDRGLILQEGANAICISDALDDYPFDFTQLFSETFADKVLAAGNTDAELVRYVRFREFLKDAQMMYDYYDSRIIVFNDAYAYAYVYSLKSKMWGTMANTFKTCVNAYPNTYAVDKTAYTDETSKKRFNIVNVYNENPTADTPYFLCTRPFSLDAPDIHKTMFSIIARGYFRNADKGKCGMVLYGSNDLFHWHPIGSSVNRYLRGLAGSPYKYFRLALTGSLSVDESITGFSADYIERWQNRLR